MANWKIPGREDPSLKTSRLRPGIFSDEFQIETTHAFRVDLARDADQMADLPDVDESEDILEIELEDGSLRWVRADQFRQEHTPRGARGEPTAEMVFPTHLNLTGRSRGIGDWAVKTVRRLKVRIQDKVIEELAASLATPGIRWALEKKFMPNPGLFKWHGGTLLEPAREIEASTKPILVFLHGTFSSTVGSFGDLATQRPGDIISEPKSKFWLELRERYDGRIYSLDHHTLKESPIENAIQVAQALPPNATLHLVSHSRGGMIGELLCRAQRHKGDPFDDLDLEVIGRGVDDHEPPDYRKSHRDSLDSLNKLLKASRPRIDRFVRVACPAGGTSLASGRLDEWLSILVNAIGMVPVLAASPTYNLVSSVLLAVLKKRMDPQKFPGIEAMLPRSPLVKVLNRPDIVTEADLSVIAGDLEGSGVWGSLKTFALDKLFVDRDLGQDHDVVVNTNSMYAGAARPGPAKDGATKGLYFFDQGSQVDHFHYFSNDKTARKVRDGLARELKDAAGFDLLAGKRTDLAKQRAEMRGAVSRSGEDPNRPSVYILPGIMGSTLACDGDDVWIDLVNLARGSFSKLRFGDNPVTPNGLLPRSYAELVKHLAASHRVVPFPYDWRSSLKAQAIELARSLKSDLDSTEQTQQPVRIVAHSMGGLLARAMIANHAEIWNRLAARKGSRLVMLGTPNGGSHSILQALLGRERLVQLLALVDFRNSKSDILRILSGFPGILEMLPDDNGQLFNGESWKKLAEADGRGWWTPDEGALAEAARVHRKIRTSPLDPQRMIYVAGVAPATPIGFEIDKNGRGRIRIIATSRGDGRVPWETGIPKEIPTWYMPAEHGELAAHTASFAAIEELLVDGTTAKLSRTAPITDRGAAETFELADEETAVYPDSDEIQAAASGFTRRARERQASERLLVAVRHDHVAFARYPVLVGHHLDDGIFGAEAALNRLLENRLEQAKALGLYPGQVGECEIFLGCENCASSGGRKGAIVVGLGAVGELLPNRLEKSVTQGVLRYASELSETGHCEEDGPDLGNNEKPIRARISSLAIGSGFGGLSQRDSVRAILQAVLRANRILAEARLRRRVQITEIEFVDLFEARATETALTVQGIQAEPFFAEQVETKGGIIYGSAGRRRIPIDETASWWHRLRIARRSEQDCTLSFTTMTGRARAEDRLLPLQLADVDRFLEQAVSNTRWNERVANTLFHLLLPNDLKQLGTDHGNLVLVLDSHAARYPWELLHDRTRGEQRPMVTQSGLIRQLITPNFRTNVEQAVAARALVVGDPPSDFAELPGAQAEAEQAVRCLREAGIEVGNPEIRTSADSIISSLYAEDYQILHLAGHGVFRHQPKQPDSGTGNACKEDDLVSGMVIGDGRYLTPALVEQMPRVPEFVFINCCHLGREGSGDKPRKNYHLLAENLGTEFIRMGVRAVIAAGWAVDDLAAQTFASEFYREFLSGEEFGRAVQHARELTFYTHKAVNTWGAYQCYGNPNFRLRLRSRPSGGRRAAANFASPEHAVLEIEGIVAQAKVLDGSQEALQARLKKIVDSLDATWLRTSARLNEAIGAAAAELGQFDEAVTHYERALLCERARVSLTAVEQLANCRVRWASRLAKVESPKMDPRKLIQTAIDDLNRLLEFGKTGERYVLLGGAYRRLYSLSNDPNDLDQMAQGYRNAYKLFLESGDHRLAYALTNWLTARLSGNDSEYKLDPDSVDGLLREAEQRLKNVESPDVWTCFMEYDCEVIRRLYRGNLQREAGRLAKKYKEAAMRAGSPREIDSVVGALEFQISVLSGLRKSKKKAGKAGVDDPVDGLNKLIRALRSGK